MVTSPMASFELIVSTSSHFTCNEQLPPQSSGLSANVNCSFHTGSSVVLIALVLNFSETFPAVERAKVSLGSDEPPARNEKIYRRVTDYFSTRRATSGKQVLIAYGQFTSSERGNA